VAPLSQGEDSGRGGRYVLRRLQGYVLSIFYVQNAISPLISTFGNGDKAPRAPEEQGIKA
jgi:hypothetical protein